MNTARSTAASLAIHSSRSGAWPSLVAALVAGLTVGWLDRTATEVQGPLLLAMGAAFAVALAGRAPAWAIAIATVLGLPIAHTVGYALGGRDGASWGMLIAVVPTMIAAYAGAGTGSVLQTASALVERRLLFAIALVGCAVAGYGPVYAALVARAQPFAWWVAAIWQLVTLVAWSLATPFIVRAWQRLHARTDGTPGPRELAAHAAVVIAVALVHSVLMPLGTRALFIPLGSASSTAVELWTLAAYLPLDALTYAVVTSIAYGSDADRRARAAAFREGAARGELAVARLDGLRAQLQPHFLFNALNTASVLASRGDAAGTRRVLAGLADLLRYVVREPDSPTSPRTGMVPLHEEIAFIEQYLAIEHERFPERLRATIDVAPDARDVSVPALLLQPLVENAIKHGVGGRIGAGVIIIRAWRDSTTLRLSVSDDGPGLTTTVTPEAAGIGLANTRARLSVLYGQRASVALESRSEGGAIATITLPV
ncbi:MAG TPA: histidine kinase [Gemmatimonadaceae bacterium]|nr:histidine kinase [Gemmatimonadaceae bacterium]